MKKYISTLFFILCSAVTIDLQASSGIEVRTKVLGLHSEYNVVGVMKRLRKNIKGIVVEGINVVKGEVNFIIPQGQSFDFANIKKAIFSAGFCMSDDKITLESTGTVTSHGSSFIINLENSQNKIVIDLKDKILATKLADIAQKNDQAIFNIEAHFNAQKNNFSAVKIITLENKPKPEKAPGKAINEAPTVK